MRMRPQAPDILAVISAHQAAGEAFALATVVRTVSATAAKAGARAVILPDGTISAGWIGGGCARAAVITAAKDALADGQPRLVSVQPGDVLNEQGVRAGDEHGGVRFAENMCPSRGTMDIFVEPVLPRPQVIVCGSSPVAVAVADLARRTGFAVTVCAPAAEQAAFADADRRVDAYAVPAEEASARYWWCRRKGAAMRRRCGRRSQPRSTMSPSSAAAARRPPSVPRSRGRGSLPSGWLS
jgi:xanthine dehydrogenase accessory factor